MKLCVVQLGELPFVFDKSSNPSRDDILSRLRMSDFRGIRAARERSDGLDRRIEGLSAKLAAVSDAVAVVALGAYGRRELTPRTEVELLFLHQGELSTPWVTEAVCYPLWEHNIRAEPSVRTLFECAADARRSWSASS